MDPSTKERLKFGRGRVLIALGRRRATTQKVKNKNRNEDAIEACGSHGSTAQNPRATTEQGDDAYRADQDEAEANRTCPDGVILRCSEKRQTAPPTMKANGAWRRTLRRATGRPPSRGQLCLELCR